MKYIKSNIGFIISMAILAIIAFNGDAKSLVLKGLLKTGLFGPQFKEGKADADSPTAAVFRSADGQHVDIADSKGKVIFINFWATWCPPCIAEMPSIDKLAKHFKDEQELLFLLVNADGDMEGSQRFFEKHGYNFSAFVPAGPVAADIFEGTLPTTLIIDKKGKVVYRREGIADYGSDKTKSFIEGLLRE